MDTFKSLFKCCYLSRCKQKAKLKADPFNHYEEGAERLSKELDLVYIVKSIRDIKATIKSENHKYLARFYKEAMIGYDTKDEDKNQHNLIKIPSVSSPQSQTNEFYDSVSKLLSCCTYNDLLEANDHL